MYGKALRDFLNWWEQQGSPSLGRTVVEKHKSHLVEQGYSASSINLRLAAIRRFALRAADEGLVPNDDAACISRIRGAKNNGMRTSNSLTDQEAERLMNTPNPHTIKGRRDRALLALLVACGLRRSEVVRLLVEDMQCQEGRWVLMHVVGIRGKARNVPVPPWAKQAVVHWLQASEIRQGPIFRAVNRDGNTTKRCLSAPMVLAIVKAYGKQIGLETRPRDLRSTCARLCRSRGADLEQIQLLLGHSNIQLTTESLGTRQSFGNAANDALDLRWHKMKKVPK